MSITQPESVAVALGIQHALRMSHIVICDMPRSTMSFYIISQMSQFSKKFSEHKK
jgi:hypothetical protein